MSRNRLYDNEGNYDMKTYIVVLEGIVTKDRIQKRIKARSLLYAKKLAQDRYPTYQFIQAEQVDV